MKFGTIANPQQVNAMTRVLAAYCKHAEIGPGIPEEEHVAALVLALHEVGVRGENDLLNALIVPQHRLPDSLSSRTAA